MASTYSQTVEEGSNHMLWKSSSQILPPPSPPLKLVLISCFEPFPGSVFVDGILRNPKRITLIPSQPQPESLRLVHIWDVVDGLQALASPSSAVPISLAMSSQYCAMKVSFSESPGGWWCCPMECYAYLGWILLYFVMCMCGWGRNELLPQDISSRSPLMAKQRLVGKEGKLLPQATKLLTDDVAVKRRNLEMADWQQNVGRFEANQRRMNVLAYCCPAYLHSVSSRRVQGNEQDTTAQPQTMAEPREKPASPSPFASEGINPHESVSDHMYRMANQVDEETRARAIKMALVHDLGEALIGDITPSDGVPEGDEKAARLVQATDALECMDQAVIYENVSSASQN
ncbi:HD domain-containing protein 2 [Sarracenia purpurea var. burkii]